jgi:hypothetical protein
MCIVYKPETKRFQVSRKISRTSEWKSFQEIITEYFYTTRIQKIHNYFGSYKTNNLPIVEYLGSTMAMESPALTSPAGIRSWIDAPEQK